MEYEQGRLVFVFTLLCALLFPLNALKKHKNLDPTIAPVFKDGEWNRKCRTNTDCGTFGYICARNNKTCQCAKHYLINYKVKLCLGGIDQQCHYDEHCIQNAFCMNQESCQCKDKWPIQSNDGLECSNKAPLHINIFAICVTTVVLLCRT